MWYSLLLRFLTPANYSARKKVPTSKIFLGSHPRPFGIYVPLAASPTRAQGVPAGYDSAELADHASGRVHQRSSYGWRFF
jgi:hypothetical protein